MVHPYASLYILALGGNTAQIGLINSLIPLMGLVILPIAGYLAGRTNRVRLIILSNTMLIINVLIMAFAPTWQVYAVATALMGLAAFQFPARSSLVADSMQPGQRGKGFATLNTISNSLAIVAPFIAGTVITIYGDLRGMRLLLICMAALYGTATLIHLPVPPRYRRAAGDRRRCWVQFRQHQVDCRFLQGDLRDDPGHATRTANVAEGASRCYCAQLHGERCG